MIFVFFAVRTLSGVFNWGFADNRDKFCMNVSLGFQTQSIAAGLNRTVIWVLGIPKRASGIITA
jgi:hypothetical protein